MIRVVPAGKKFDVDFDPARANVAAMLDAIRALGYQPSLDGAVQAWVDGPAAKVMAKASAPTIAPGAEGTIQVSLEPKAGQRVGGDGLAVTSVRVVGEAGLEAGPAVEVKEALQAKRDLTVTLRVARDAAAGPRTVTVQVTLQAQGGEPRTVELRVPVTIG